MNARLFNICILLGWLLVVGGTCMRSLSIGLIVGGALMLVIVAAVSWLAGVYVPKGEG